jgi:hypothetical protein
MGKALVNTFSHIASIIKRPTIVILVALAPLSYGEVPDNFWADYLDM